jgi:hypothetical protein
MKFISDYLRLILFCSGLLIGVQIPAFVNEYQKRVDAHLSEAQTLIAGFKQTAERYFSGDLAALIKHYEQSEDRIFRDDANNIRYIVDRVNLLQTESAALSANPVSRVLHVLFRHDKTLMSETFAQYSYVILIDISALIWGVLVGLVIAATLDIGVAGIRQLYSRYIKGMLVGLNKPSTHSK